MTDEQERSPESDAEAQPAGQAPDAPSEVTSPAPRVEPPRAFDDESTPEALEPVAPADEADAALDADEDSEGASEVVTAAEPDSPEAFEDIEQLPGLLEALLFVADHPIDVPYISRAVEVSQARVERALDELAEALRDSGRGVRLQRGHDGVQLTSAPEAASFVERFLGLEATRRLSTAALETLAIIAYRQPITRGQIDAIRGVSSDGAVATLRARDLIESAGHAPGPGRPMLFRTTGRFLEHFGLERPGQLPPLPEDVDLPPSEIQATLGLDEAAIEEALRPREPEPTGATGDTEDAGAGSAAEAVVGDGSDEAAAKAIEARESEPEPAEDAALDELIQAVAAAEATGIEIPSDIQALSAAAEHAFTASRDRAEGGSDASDDPADVDEADDGEADER